MKQLTCEMCGGTDLMKQDGVFVCQSCGTRYSVEEAKKMMVEGTIDVSGSTVKVDTSDELTNLYQIARRARDDGNSESAAKYYDMILVKDPTSWEAQFYSVYFQVSTCKVGEIENASITLANCLGNVLAMIKEHVPDKAAQAEAVEEIARMCLNLSIPMLNGIWSLYQPDGYYNNPQYFAAKSEKIIYIFTTLRAETEKFFDVNDPMFSNLNVFVKSCEETVRESFAQRTKNEAAKRGCYVATAVYGSYDCPQVWTLRRFRDYTLAETWYGRAFIRAYYAISPTLVKWFGHTEWFKGMWRGTLDRMVANLNAEGVENTPYEDKNW